MLQRSSYLDVADNTGAKEAAIIGIPGQNTLFAWLGDRVKVAIKSSIPDASTGAKKGDVADAVIVRTKHAVRRSDGTWIRFDSNACVLIDDKGQPKGTRIFGPIARELRVEKSYSKILSLAKEVV